MNLPSKEAIELVRRIREKMAGYYWLNEHEAAQEVDEFVREQKLESDKNAQSAFSQITNHE